MIMDLLFAMPIWLFGLPLTVFLSAFSIIGQLIYDSLMR